jgi:hypothetical protein
MKMTFAGYTRSTTLKGFPVLVALRESDTGFQHAQCRAPQGADIRFMDGEGKAFIPHEPAQWNREGLSYYWVRCPRISGPTDGLWVYWGGKVVEQRHGAVWNRDYHSVWHFSEKSGECADATRNACAAVPVRGNAQGAKGRFGRGLLFNGDGSKLSIRRALPIGTTSNTVSAWVRVPVPGQGGLSDGERVGVFLGNYNGRPCTNYEIYKAGQMRLYWNAGALLQLGTTDLRDGKWHHIAWVRDKEKGSFALYVDGKVDATANTAGADLAFRNTHRIGGDSRDKSPKGFHGGLDELRISRVARSADWLWASWKNQSDPESFLKAGTAEKTGNAEDTESR